MAKGANERLPRQYVQRREAGKMVVCAACYVTQQVFLFHDTIKNNLNRLLDSEPTEAEIWHALGLATAKDFVQKLSDGLNALVGASHGVNEVSGGDGSWLRGAAGALDLCLTWACRVYEIVSLIPIERILTCRLCEE